MTITPDQARELLDGATPGPWSLDRDHPEEDACVMAYRIENGLLIGYRVTDFIEEDADAALIAAAPDMAETIIDQAKRIEELEAQLAGMEWQWGVQTDAEDIWADNPDQEALVEQAAAMPGNHLLRRLVSASEVIEGA